MIVELFPEDDVSDVQSAVKMILEERWTFGWEDDPPEVTGLHRVDGGRRLHTTLRDGGNSTPAT